MAATAGDDVRLEGWWWAATWRRMMWEALERRWSTTHLAASWLFRSRSMATTMVGAAWCGSGGGGDAARDSSGLRGPPCIAPPPGDDCD